MRPRAPPKRASYHHGDLRAALIRAALDLAAEQPLDAVTLRAVAREAGVSAAAPYHHFKDRDALLKEVAEEGFRELTRQLSEVDQSSPKDPITRLRALGQAYVHFALGRPAHFRVMFRVRTLQESETSSGAFALLREAVSEVMATRGVSSHGRVRVLNAWALVHGFATLALDGPLRTLSRVEVEQLASQVISLSVQGLTADLTD